MGSFPVAYGQIYCGRKRRADFRVQVFYKVIGGAEALSSISREFHVPPAPDAGPLVFPKGQLAAESAAGDYLSRDVYLCGGRSTLGAAVDLARAATRQQPGALYPAQPP